jgi:hypothetical protein
MDKDATDSDEYGRVWEGSLVRVFQGLGISNGHYSRVRKTLEETGCIQLLRKGARDVTSLVALVSRPTADNIEGVRTIQDHLTRRPEPAMLEQRVRELERRLEGIDVKALFHNLHQRVEKLERVKKGK